MTVEVEACRDCGRTAEESNGEVIDGLCDDCASNYTYCTVCKEDLDRDTASYRHRHLYYDCERGKWLGVGGQDMEERDYDVVRDSLHMLCDFLGGDFALALGITIRLGEMGFEAVHFSGSTFGYDSVFISLSGPTPNPKYRNGYKLWMRFLYGSEIESWSRQFDIPDLEEQLTPAIQWIIGLDNDKTPESNEKTLAWLDEYMRRPEPAILTPNLAPPYR
jgi:hypothetical protein